MITNISINDQWIKTIKMKQKWVNEQRQKNYKTEKINKEQKQQNKNSFE